MKKLFGFKEVLHGNEKLSRHDKTQIAVKERIARYIEKYCVDLNNLLEIGAETARQTLLYSEAMGSQSGRIVVYDWIDQRAEEVKNKVEFKKVNLECDSFPEKDANYDVVVCNQVLEHIDRPAQALAEIRRVLRPGGAAIIGTPFYYYLHGVPDDYFRYTDQGLRVILGDAGFDVEEVHPYGGYFSAVVEPANILLTALGLGIPIWQQIVNATNYVILVAPAYWGDRALKTYRFFPSGFITVARRNG